MSVASALLGASGLASAFDAIVPVEHNRSVSASVTACSQNDADDMNFGGVGLWDVAVQAFQSCPDGASGDADAEQESFIEPEHIFATSVVAGTTVDAAQTCGPVSSAADSAFVLEFELTRFATVTIDASVSAFGGDTGYGQASVSFGSIVDLYVEGIAVGGDDDSASTTVTLLPGVYTLDAWASGTASSNCCCDVGTGEFEVDFLVHPAGDANHDFQVDILDLELVLVQWGTCPGPPAICNADVNGDLFVNVLDLLIVLSTWS